jgi:hypothetical protein
LEALKTNGNFCDMTRHGISENASQFAFQSIVFPRTFLAGAGGIEPPNGGIKIRSPMTEVGDQCKGSRSLDEQRIWFCVLAVFSEQDAASMDGSTDV